MTTFTTAAIECVTSNFIAAENAIKLNKGRHAASTADNICKYNFDDRAAQAHNEVRKTLFRKRRQFNFYTSISIC